MAAKETETQKNESWGTAGKYKTGSDGRRKQSEGGNSKCAFLYVQWKPGECRKRSDKIEVCRESEEKMWEADMKCIHPEYLTPDADRCSETQSAHPTTPRTLHLSHYQPPLPVSPQRAPYYHKLIQRDKLLL